MDNEKFQELVLKKLESLENGQQTANERLNQIESRLGRIETRQDAVFEQTAGLTEFRTEANRKLDDIANTVDYLTHKESQTEKDIFVIKKSISLSK